MKPNTAAIATTVAALLLVACGSSSSSTSVTTAEPAGVATTVAPPAAPPAAATSPTGEPYGVYRRVNFSPGTDNLTVSDPAAAGTVNGYVYEARAGQDMYVNVSTTERYAAGAAIYGPDGTLLAEPAPQDPTVTPFNATTGGTFNVDLVLPADGDYLIVVNADPGFVADLEVEITGSASSSAPAAAACTSYKDNITPPIKLCDKGEVVKEIQGALTVAGYPVQADGFFGPSTQQAVTEYQVEYELDVNGTVDDITYFLMFGD